MEILYPLSIEKSNTITDKKELTKYIWAFSLGDGSLLYDHHKNRPNINENAYFSCDQVSRNEDYILWRANILSSITSVNIQKKVNKESEMLCTRVNRHPIFTTMRNRIYLNGVKIVEPHYLKLLDWESLAILFMDDGCCSIKDKKYGYYCLTLSTQSFSYGDNVLLQREIKNKTDILFSIVRMTTQSGGIQYRLQLQKQLEIDKFIAGVRKFITPSFEYKINKNSVRLTPEMDDEIV